MHIQLERTVLLEHLELLGRVSTKHVTLPVLQCVRIEAEQSKVVLRTTNLEIGIEAVVPGEVTTPGVVAVPTTTLQQTIQYSTEKYVTLELQDTVLLVRSGSSQTNINTIPHEEFPTIPKINNEGQTLNGAMFALGIKSAAFAASVSSIKPELGSVLVSQNKEHSLTFVATDSFRLMEKTIPQKNLTLEESILIPAKNAQELARVCEMLTEQSPQLMVNENQCALLFPKGVYITSRLINGSFPDYNQIIPKEYSTHVTLLKNDLIQVFKKTNIFLNKFQQITLDVTSTGITISTSGGEVGATKDSLKAQVEGESLKLNFNQRYIAEALQYLPEESLVLHFAGIGRPLVIEGVNDHSARYLVMPMNR